MAEVSKVYDPEKVEAKWYALWLEKDCFKADPKPDSDENYCIMIPPPNVTGVLTMGHVLNITIQDMLIRRARQQGKSALWFPGTDHAGIATQTRVEKALRKDGLTRHDLGREAFLEHAVKWRDQYGGLILEQLKRLGASCDWDRSVHTLDSDYSHAVLTAFVKLYNEGYIYRGKRMINWCPASLTALSDEEVIMKPQKGILYKIRYERADAPGQYLEISTTRPETLMGDTAIAVNPSDERYKGLVGKYVWRPFPKEKIPVIADEAVEQDFGTGVLKVTPAHDPLDFEIGQRHKLPVRDVFNPNATLNALAGEPFVGLDRFKARKAVAKKLDELGLLVEEEAYDNNVGFSERADVPIEPRISEQWFLKYPKVEEAKDVIRKGLIKFWPERWQKTYLHWLDNIQDWCISRQLWWGHRIPVWYKKDADRKDSRNWHISVEGPSDFENWEQDDDVLDTWASSWLWPFATLGWPDEKVQKEKGFKAYYPTDALVTGPDIIFFWVSRMIIAALEFMDDADVEKRIPFKNVYFTGIIRDVQGRKMSKSLGNSPDPIDLIQKYGADGLRLGIMSIAPQGRDILFSEERILLGRNFCNKLWNVCRFRQMSGEMHDNSSLQSIVDRLDLNVFDTDDHAILYQLGKCLEEYERYFENYDFFGITQEFYIFFWNDFCDWFVEVSKFKLQSDSLKENCLAIQDLVIRQVLLMFHPVIPFITEELWHQLGYGKNDDFIQNQKPETKNDLNEIFPEGISVNESQQAGEIFKVREFVSKARALKAKFQLASKKDLTFYYTGDDEEHKCLQSHLRKVKDLIGAKDLLRKDEISDHLAATSTRTFLGILYIDLKKADIDIDAEKSRLGKELVKIQKYIATSEAKLKNEKFLNNAPDSVVQATKEHLDELKKDQADFESIKKSLSDW